MEITTIKGKVWLIDDDDFYLFALEKLMQIHKIASEILTFPSGEDALDFLSRALVFPEQLPEVIMLDINMPVMDGWQFLEHFIRINPKLEKKIHLYMMSSSINHLDINKAKSYDVVTDYLVKPLRKEDLVRVAYEVQNFSNKTFKNH